MPDAVALFDALAPEYETSFYDPPHRHAYDQLAWEHVLTLLPAYPATIVEAGCGSGRWVERLLRLGHCVVGIEQSPQMVAALERRNFGPRFSLVQGDMQSSEIAPGSADVVLAMGSLQYTRDPAAVLHRFASWTRPGGVVCVLVDSLVALVLELLHAGKRDEAFRRAQTGRGLWQQHGCAAELQLFDRETLANCFAAAGLTAFDCKGLLITASALGRAACTEQLRADESSLFALERQLSSVPQLADAGKQILAFGRRPLEGTAGFAASGATAQGAAAPGAAL